MGKRSRAATKGLRPTKTITGSQRKARRLNIEVARRAKIGGHAGAPARSLPAAAKQQRKLRAALRQKTIRSTGKTTSAKGRARMKKRLQANIDKYGAFKLSRYGGMTLSGSR